MRGTTTPLGRENVFVVLSLTHPRVLEVQNFEGRSNSQAAEAALSFLGTFVGISTIFHLYQFQAN